LVDLVCFVYLVHLVGLVYLVSLVDLVHLVSFVQPKNQTNKTNQINKTDQIASSRGEVGNMAQDMVLGACPTVTDLLRPTIRDHLRRARPEKILNVFQRIHLRFFQACGLASGRTFFASPRTAMSDRLLSLYNPKYLLLKMPYRFNTGYQLRACSSAFALCEWVLSLDPQRSRP
jgi:hypothetical protein